MPVTAPMRIHQMEPTSSRSRRRTCRQKARIARTIGIPRGMTGRGKRGGLRVIYYLRRKPGQIWMLTLYGKNVQENIPAHLLRQMKEAIDDGKDD